jgi:superfamily II DNA or RNA helicase
MPKSRIAFWREKLQGNKRRDAQSRRQLKAEGWSILVVWDCQVAPAIMDRLRSQIARFFNTTLPFIQGNPDLRDPQVEGRFRTLQHFRNSSEHAILHSPVGCGKTGLMSV